MPWNRSTFTRRHGSGRLAAGLGVVALGGRLAMDTPVAEASGRMGEVFTLTNQVAGNAVAIFARANNGALSPAGTVPTGGRGTGGGLGNQGALTLAEEGRWLLAVNPGSDDLSLFRVHADRLELTDLVKSGGMLPISVTIHDDLVYVLNDGGTANVTGFRIERRGKLRLLPGSTKPLSTAAPDAAQVGFSPDGDVLVVTEKGTNLISTYRIGRDGLAAGPRPQPSNGATPFGFAFLPQRDRLLVTEAAGGAPDASTVSLYDVEDGRLRVLDGKVPTR